MGPVLLATIVVSTGRARFAEHYPTASAKRVFYDEPISRASSQVFSVVYFFVSDRTLASSSATASPT